MLQKIICISLIVVFCSVFFADEYTVPYAKTTPVLDGVFQEGEWSDALEISGAGIPLDLRRTRLFLKFDDSNLYIGALFEAPPKGKLGKSGKHICLDDSIELWFVPPSEIRSDEELKFGEFQYFINFLGEELDYHRNPGYGLPPRPWRHGKLGIAQSIRDDLWTMELCFPAKAFGMNSIPDSDWRMLIVRNFLGYPAGQNPMTEVASMTIFADPTAFSTFHFRRNAPAIHQTYAPGSRLPLMITANDTDGLTAHCQKGRPNPSENTVAISPTNFAETLPPSSLPLTIDQNPAEGNIFRITVKDAKGGILFNRGFTTSPMRDRIWFTPEAYLVADADFENAEAPAKVVEGRRPQSRALRLAADDSGRQPVTISTYENGASNEREALAGSRLSLDGIKCPVPGNLSTWVRNDAGAIQKYRRIFTLHQPDAGYLGFQILPDGLPLLFFHDFTENPRINYHPSRKLIPDEWTHLSLNLHPDHFEFYMNGIKLLEDKFPFELSNLENLSLGGGVEGGFDLDEFQYYSRVLTDEEIKAVAQGETPVTGSLSYYPSLNSIVADLNVSKNNMTATELILKVTDKTGKEFLSESLKISNGYETVTHGQSIMVMHESAAFEEPLADGDYLVSVYLPQAENPLIEKEFHVKHFEWENNTLGLSDVVLPGFTPLKRQNDTISCILRDYTIDSTGFPKSVVAKGKEILAAPIALHLTRNGLDTTLSDGEIAFGAESDTAVEYAAQSNGFRINGRMEQDGMLRLDIAFPDTIDADEAYVDIPVKKDFAELYHAVGQGMRINPAGFLPEGTGEIFRATAVPQTYLNGFVPYVWVGTDDRGICYAADWDKGWFYSEEQPAQTIVRHENGDVSIRLNILNKGFAAEKGRVVTIALMASPVKQMPDCRGWGESWPYRSTQQSLCLSSPPYWGNFSCWLGRYPAWHNFELVRKLDETRRTGVIDQSYADAWIERLLKGNSTEVPWITGKADPRQFTTAHVNTAFHHIKNLLFGAPKSAMYYYTCDKDEPERLPEYKYFSGEWFGFITKSYQDYAIYYLDKMLEAGMDGIYNDCVFFTPNFQWAAGSAYIDANGTVHPSFGLWLSRAWRKRELTLMVERGLERPWLTVHHTNTNILPTLSFATNSMGMEWKYGRDEFQKRFTHDYIRVCDQGLQGGFFPTVLDGIDGTKSPEEKTWITRTMLATLLPHEVKPTWQRGSDSKTIVDTYNHLYDFGYHEKDCVFTPYWSPENPVEVLTDGVIVSTYQRGNRLLAVVSGDTARDGVVMLALKSGAVKSAKDLEGVDELFIEKNVVAFQLKHHDFKLVEILPQEEQ